MYWFFRLIYTPNFKIKINKKGIKVMKNKKILIWAMLFAIIFTSLTGCSSKRENSEINSNNSQEETASNDNDVNLIVWCEEDTFDIINKMC